MTFPDQQNNHDQKGMRWYQTTVNPFIGIDSQVQG
jgi:hypothetical protein